MTKAKILVVEDEGIVALNIQSDLESRGYDVPVVVASGEEAVKEAERTRPDLVLMDITLSGDMDGVEAATQIRAHLDIPVVYLTAFADDKTLQRAKIAEPYGYILKPFDERELHTTIEITLHKRKAEQERRRGGVTTQPGEEVGQREPEAGIPGEAAAAEAPPPPSEELTILLIEDDALSASVVELTLNSEGYRVLTAPNGLQGLKMAKANLPDLILLDLMLPGMDGFEVLSELRADPKTASVPVAIISAKGQAEDRQLADRLGADAYLPKAYERGRAPRAGAVASWGNMTEVMIWGKLF
jgi:CheY-like chemotaxis protein